MARTQVIGLTGGIASGKSRVAAMFRDLGAEVIDADLLARQVVEPGRPAYKDIVSEFGQAALAEDGTIDRKALGAIVFADEEKRARLNLITHPRIAAAAQAETARLFAQGASTILYEAALLVESGLHKTLDGLIVVSAPRQTQVERIMARDGMDEAEANGRIEAQLPLNKKTEVATYVIDNSGSLDETSAQVAEVWQKMSAA